MKTETLLKQTPRQSEGPNEESSAQEPQRLRKRSFLKLPVAVDVKQLLREYAAIPEDAWGVSHWDVHCSINVLLLRGGQRGKADDFTTDAVEDNPVLESCPYLSSLLDEDGPFGGTVYAFLFRTKPNGITRVHHDDDEAWHRTFRVHIPLITNDKAVLISEGMAKHFGVGEVWTFDNQSLHSVVNGDSTRVHLIVDVLPKPKLVRLFENAEFDPGTSDPDGWALTGEPTDPPLRIGLGEPLSTEEKASLGLDQEAFTTRITKLGRRAKLLRSGLRLGDVLTTVNGAYMCPRSRTALDHVHYNYKPGDTVTLGVLREGRAMELVVKLKPQSYFSPAARVAQFFSLVVRSVGYQEKVDLGA